MTLLFGVGKLKVSSSFCDVFVIGDDFHGVSHGFEVVFCNIRGFCRNIIKSVIIKELL